MSERVTWAAVGRIAEALSQRDLAIVKDVGRVRVLTGRQVERLHFAELSGAHSDRFLHHNLVVAELYVGLMEAMRVGRVELRDFRAEPGCWWLDSDRQWVKPDGYAVVSDGNVEDCWAIEVDMATESVPTLRRK